MRNDGLERMEVHTSMQTLAEELARARWIEDQRRVCMETYNKLVPVDDPDVSEDFDGNAVDLLEFANDCPDDLITKGVKSGKFYFYDETMTNLVGPYDTYELAQEAETRYFADLDDYADELGYDE